MPNNVEYRQATNERRPGTDEIFVLNQTDPVYVKKEALLTGDDILSADVQEDSLFGNAISIKLSEEGMNLINQAAKDKDFPMLVFFVNGKSMQVIHKIDKLDQPEIMMTTNEDHDFTVALAELIKSGVRAES
jgi:preprotein translocase subunit SecD